MATILERMELLDSPTPEDIRELLQLAKGARKVGKAVDDSYFRLLLNLALKGTLKASHDYLYALVKEECITPDMDALERNSATNFARSAYSVLKSIVKAGHTLDKDLTKNKCVEMIKRGRVPIESQLDVKTRQLEQAMSVLVKGIREGTTTMTQVTIELNARTK